MPQSSPVAQLSSNRSNAICIGPLTLQLLSGATWAGVDGFPHPQAWADDIERVLTFLKHENRFSEVLPAIQKAKNPQHRDSLFAEARAAFYLSRHGFRILEWEPVGEGGKVGDLLVSCL